MSQVSRGHARCAIQRERAQPQRFRQRNSRSVLSAHRGRTVPSGDRTLATAQTCGCFFSSRPSARTTVNLRSPPRFPILFRPGGLARGAVSGRSRATSGKWPALRSVSFGSGRNDVEIVKPIRIARPTRQISKSVCTTSFDATEHLGSDRLKTITSTASSRGRRWPRDQLRSRHASKRTAFMANPSQVPVLHPAIERLKDAIAQQEKTVEELRAAGHLYTDAERYLLQLKDRLKHL